MSGRVHRLLRKQAGEMAQRQAKVMAPTIAAIDNNERTTRQRVDGFEIRMDATEANVKTLHDVLARGPLGRLKWLFTGR